MSLDGPHLTYGGSTGAPRPKNRRRRLAALIIGPIVGAALMLIGLLAFATGGDEPDPKTSSPASPTATTPAPTVQPSPEEAPPSGRDAEETGGTGSSADAKEAAEQFIHAWLDPNRATRLPALRRVSTADLYGQVANTDPAKLPDSGLAGPASVVASSPYSVVFEQRFNDGLRISVVMVADPQAAYGWLAQDVAPVEE